MWNNVFTIDNTFVVPISITSQVNRELQSELQYRLTATFKHI